MVLWTATYQLSPPPFFFLPQDFSSQTLVHSTMQLMLKMTADNTSVKLYSFFIFVKNSFKIRLAADAGILKTCISGWQQLNTCMHHCQPLGIKSLYRIADTRIISPLYP